MRTRSSRGWIAALSTVAVTVVCLAFTGLAVTAAQAASTGDSKDGRTIASPGLDTDTITAPYGEGAILPIVLTRTSEPTDLSGKVYFVYDGTQLTSVETGPDGGLFVQEKVFPASLTVGTHSLIVYYCATANGQQAVDQGKAACPKAFDQGTWYGNAQVDGKWLQLSRTLEVVKDVPQITISLSRKLVALADVKSGTKTVDLYAMVTAPGVKDSLMNGTMEVLIDGKKVTKAIVISSIAIPDSSTKKPAIRLILDPKWLSKAKSYQIQILYTPSGETSTWVTTLQSNVRTLVISK